MKITPNQLTAIKKEFNRACIDLPDEAIAQMQDELDMTTASYVIGSLRSGNWHMAKGQLNHLGIEI